MSIASKHLQFSLLAGLVTIFGLTVGFSHAEDTNALPNIAYTFVMTEPNGITDDSNVFAGAKFDIQGFTNHPCYQIAGIEAKICNDQYGLTAPLKTYVNNGMLYSYLNQKGLLAKVDVNSVLVGGAGIEPVEIFLPPVPVSTAKQDDVSTLRSDHNDKLWAICIRKTPARAEATACYQRNIRLTLRYRAELHEEDVR